ncbi:MAG: hypothetical protein IKH41_00180 [Clostridia bacterium]|nr:hypothetical protein [Clostridia bacterium]
MKKTRNSFIYQNRWIFILLLIVTAPVLFLLASCDRENRNDCPAVSMDLLKFTPASPGKQILTKEGRSPQIIITNYNETATDALGRKLPASDEVGLPKEGKYVGLFYSLWTSEISAPVDVTKALALDPVNTDYGSRWGFCFWSEPETGYHKADDVWQIKRDMYYFAMAGVDFLYFDMTNGYLYEDAMTVFLDTCLELRSAGQMTPYVVPWCFGTDMKAGNGDIGKFYELFISDEKYADLWFYWDGKPLAMIKCTDDGEYPIFDDANYKDKLTFRKAWVGSGQYWWGDGSVLYGYGYGWRDDPEKAECIGIGTAAFANFGSGRSGARSGKKYLDKFLETTTMGEGITFERTFAYMMENNPECEVLLITRWNEWIAQNFTGDKPKPTDTGYVDQFNREFSRDIEPMKGGFTDNYFYQMCSIIRRFKGVLPPDGNSGKQTVDIGGGFEQWKKIAPVFTDFEGDTSVRNSTDTTGQIMYVNKTGRNDIVESRLTAGEGMVYVYARTAAPLTDPHTGKNWMLLFIDADNDKSTGWEGFDFLVNYQVLEGGLTTLCAYKDNVWQEIGVVRFKSEGSELMIAIPRSLLGLTQNTFTVNFHWMDNVTDIYSLESWFTTGDSAPERRNNYTLTLKIPYDSGKENKDSEPSDSTRKHIAYMPPVELGDSEIAALRESVTATLYRLSPDYGKMPEFGLIEANRLKTLTADRIGADVFNSISENFAADFEGYLKAEADGDYRFGLTCDDCARLYIDGRLLAECAYNADRQAGEKVSASGSLRLAAGYHKLRVEYAEVHGGNATLSLDIDGGARIYVSTVYNFDLETVIATSGEAVIGDTQIETAGSNTVLGLGEIDLSRYSKVTIYYGSDADAQLGDTGSFFALSDKKKHVNVRPMRMHNILGKEVYLENGKGAQRTPDRTAVIDLSEVEYNGPVYLSVYLGDDSGVIIYAISFAE